MANQIPRHLWSQSKITKRSPCQIKKRAPSWCQLYPDCLLFRCSANTAQGQGQVRHDSNSWITHRVTTRSKDSSPLHVLQPRYQGVAHLFWALDFKLINETCWDMAASPFQTGTWTLEQFSILILPLSSLACGSQYR